jgi:AraC-like DNA-binding protein
MSLFKNLYREYNIQKSLLPINRVWVIDNFQNKNCQENLKCLPNGAFDICFVLGQGISIVNKNRKDSFDEGIYLIGQTTETINLTIKPYTKLILFEFAPWVPCQFIKFCFLYSKNQVINFFELNKSLYNRLIKTIAYDEIELINTFRRNLDGFLSENKSSILVKNFYNLIQDKYLFNTINELSFKMGYSCRYIQGLFKENIGLTPKEYQNILRIRRGFDRIYNNTDNVSLTELSMEMDYYDQSHFYRYFKQIIQVNPSKVRTSDFLLPDKNIKSSHFYNF